MRPVLYQLFPARLKRYVEVFGGSGALLFGREPQKGVAEVYNDYNSDLANLWCCVKERPNALLAELGFLPLHCRDEFDVLHKFFRKEEFTDDYLKEELELTEVYFPPLEGETIRRLMLERAKRGDVRRAADFYKLIRCSFSGNGTAFAGRSTDIRRFFYLIWENSRRLKDVVIENKDFESLISQYDREDAFIYCDPPYYEAECYAVAFPKSDHQRLHDVLARCEGFVMVSYNYCDYICELYQDFYIFRTTRSNSMSLIAGSEYEEVVMTNYDPHIGQVDYQPSFFADSEDDRYQLIHVPNNLK